jgi:membrane associated rhomboid family serine protease
MIFLFALLVIGAFAVYVMTPAERTRLVRAAHRTSAALVGGAVERATAPDPFRDSLLARTRWVPVTAILACANVAVFAAMTGGPGSLADPATLVGWGASFGPRTSNGEWIRLLTSAFVHASVLHLLVNVIALVQAGAIAERLVGHTSVAVVYAIAAMFGGVVSLALHPVDVSAGAGAAIAGLYGLLIASWLIRPLAPAMPMPWRFAARLLPAAALFALINAARGTFAGAELAGFIVGIGCGVALAPAADAEKPSPRRIASAALATVVVALVCSVPLQGIADVRPELERIIGIEQQTSQRYDAAAGQFRLGALNARALARLIDENITPDLEAAQQRLISIKGVPPEHRQRVADATQFLGDRLTSWRLRSEALQKGNMKTLRKADAAEWNAHHVFERLTASNQ